MGVEDWSESSRGDAMHKLVLVESGQLDLQGEAGGWLIIPNHLVFIPAGRAFTICASRRTEVRVAHLVPEDAPWDHHGCWVTAASPLAREMLAHAIASSRCSPADGEAERQFFRTLSHLCRGWFATPRILWMPIARSNEVRAAVAHVRGDLAGATLTGATAAAGCSTRTLQRRCEEELGLTWRSFLREVRIMRAMELLATGETAATPISILVGFQSLAAFTTSFSGRVGLSPSQFQRRYAIRVKRSAD